RHFCRSNPGESTNRRADPPARGALHLVLDALRKPPTCVAHIPAITMFMKEGWILRKPHLCAYRTGKKSFFSETLEQRIFLSVTVAKSSELLEKVSSSRTPQAAQLAVGQPANAKASRNLVQIAPHIWAPPSDINVAGAQPGQAYTQYQLFNSSNDPVFDPAG